MRSFLGAKCACPRPGVPPPMTQELDPGDLRFSLNGCGAALARAHAHTDTRTRTHATGAVVGGYGRAGPGGRAGAAMGEAETPSFEMTWSSTTSSGYCSQEDSDSELEQYFTARTSLARRPRRDQVGARGCRRGAGGDCWSSALPGPLPRPGSVGSPTLPATWLPACPGRWPARRTVCKTPIPPPRYWLPGPPWFLSQTG